MLKKSSTLIFSHPNLRLREESFGGLAQADSGIYMLNHDEFDALSKFAKGYSTRKEIERNIGNLIKEFLDKGLLLEIDQKIVNNIIKRKREDNG